MLWFDKILQLGYTLDLRVYSINRKKQLPRWKAETGIVEFNIRAKLKQMAAYQAKADKKVLYLLM